VLSTGPTNPQIILLGFRYTTLVVILNVLTGILFLPGDLTLTTLGQTPKVLLVVPETDYYKSVPVVIGTNILRPFKSSVSDSHVKYPIMEI
jgi:hypothetical protein